MNDFLYASNGNIYAKNYIEIYVPREYFDNKNTVNKGTTLDTFGLLYIRAYPDGKETPIKFINLPTPISLHIYNIEPDEINIHGRNIEVSVLKYMKDSHVMGQTIQQGREVAEGFLRSMLDGRLPKTLNYSDIINIWWKNLEISGAKFKVPSKTFEMIIAAIYRNPNNIKERFGQVYGKSSSPNGYNYKTGDVRTVVEGLSTFSGMVFEDISRMITSGINSSIDGVEEPVSPLEKIIYY